MHFFSIVYTNASTLHGCPKSLCKGKALGTIFQLSKKEGGYFVTCDNNGPVCRKCPKNLTFNNRLKVCLQDFPRPAASLSPRCKFNLYIKTFFRENFNFLSFSFLFLSFLMPDDSFQLNFIEFYVVRFSKIFTIMCCSLKNFHHLDVRIGHNFLVLKINSVKVSRILKIPKCKVTINSFLFLVNLNQ